VNIAHSYLFLTDEYAQFLNVRWSVSDNVLEFRFNPSPRVYVAGENPADFSGQPTTEAFTFAFAEQMAEFLEGFVAWRPLIHFDFMVHLLILLRWLPPEGHPSPNRIRLWKLFAEHGGSLRHAGAFCAQLCREVPEALAAGDVVEICRRLRRSDVTIHWSMVDEGFLRRTPEFPPWSAEVFEARVLEEMDGFSDEEVQYWLEHGRGFFGGAEEKLTQELPPTLTGRLTSLLDRPRFQGGKAFVQHLAGALSLPPRRLIDPALALGGFANVTTRGQVEHLLPSQFALDEWDFVRRYGENELLFFQREDPTVCQRQELVVLLDQGIRTWGDVRLVFGAALAALEKQAEQSTRFLFATTGHPGLHDPLALSEEEWGQIVEASDFSRNPGQALKELLEQPNEGPRDIILFTHPRSLEEEEVRNAAKIAEAPTRLFALTLDRLGQGALLEMRHGSSLRVRDFRLDLSNKSPQTIEPSFEKTSDWSGDVEPIGFPFRFGIAGNIPMQGYDFDGSEKYLLTACWQGLLHLWNLDGTLKEMLPRAMFQGRVVNDVVAVVGVADGFVVVGRLRQERGAIHYQQIGAIHYNLLRRRCAVYPLSSLNYAAWGYSPENHCFLALENNQEEGMGIDLSTGDRYSTNLGGGSSRVRAAWVAWDRKQIPRRQLSIHHHATQPHITVDWRRGEVRLNNVKPVWKPFVPLADGRPLLLDSYPIDGILAGQHLGVRVRNSNTPAQNELFVFGPDGVPVHSSKDKSLGFQLSWRGNLLAKQIGNSVVTFGPANQLSTPSQTGVGGYAQKLHLALGDSRLVLYQGARPYCHYLDWSAQELKIWHGPRKSQSPSQEVAWHLGPNMDFPERFHVQSQSSAQPVEILPGQNADFPERFHYDAQRWTSWAHKNLLVASDRFGQVAVFDSHGKLVCMFIAFRQRLAGWMPDGTCFGPTLMTGKPNHAEARKKFGRALWQAERSWQKSRQGEP
jgi:hypothetical protein